MLPRVDTGLHAGVSRQGRAGRHADEHTVIVRDGAGGHCSDGLHLLPDVRLLLRLPESPELNPQRKVWDALREKFLHSRVFDRLDSAETALVAAPLRAARATRTHQEHDRMAVDRRLCRQGESEPQPCAPRALPWRLTAGSPAAPRTREPLRRVESSTPPARCGRRARTRGFVRLRWL